MTKAYLLHDLSKVYIFNCSGKSPELVFVFRAEESGGGQSDVCVLELLLDLLDVLCATDREGEEK